MSVNQQFIFHSEQYSIQEATRKAIGIFSPKELEKIQNSTVMIAVVGGANGPIVDILGRLALKNIIIADIDEKVEVKNLVQQSYCVSEIGIPKAIAKMRQLQDISPNTQIVASVVDLSIEQNVRDLIHSSNSKINLIIEGTDNLLARTAICKVAFERGIPLLSGGNIGNSYFVKYYDNISCHYGQTWQYIDAIYPNQTLWSGSFSDLSDPNTLKILQKEWIIFGICVAELNTDGVKQVLDNPLDWSYVAYTGYQVAAHKSALASQLLAGKSIDKEYQVGLCYFRFMSINPRIKGEIILERITKLREVWGDNQAIILVCQNFI